MPKFPAEWFPVLAEQIRSGEVKRPIFEIRSVNLDKTILVGFRDAAVPVPAPFRTANYYDRYELECDLSKLAALAGRVIEWFDLTPDGRGSKIKDAPAASSR
jgi:hypothetical protein